MERVTTTLTLTTKVGTHIQPHYYEEFFQTADVIHLRGSVRFVYNKDEKYYHPISGDYKVLGVVIPIKPYTFAELIALQGDRSIILDYDGTVSGCDIFDVEEYDSVIDYGATITSLETDGTLKTKPSENWLSTDGRSFSLGDISSVDGEAEWWDVDLLGTSLGFVQTRRIEQLWRLKVIKQKEQDQ